MNPTNQQQGEVPPVRKKKKQQNRTINDYSRSVKNRIHKAFIARRKASFLEARITGVWDLPEDLIRRFWVRVDKSGDCWIWAGRYHKTGYGVVDGFYERLSHRVSYQLTFGVVQEGVHILHKCDNPKCVNPDHLFPGDQALNMLDKKLKGRAKGINRRKTTI